jgi:hypothetical protein
MNNICTLLYNQFIGENAIFLWLYHLDEIRIITVDSK